MIIKYLSANDALMVRDLFVAAIMAIRPTQYTLEQKMAWIQDANDDDYWCLYLRKNRVLGAWGQDDNQQLLGFLSYQAARCYVDMLFVNPHCQRQGIANRLFNAILTSHYPYNQPRIYTHASLASKPFFQKVGFTILRHKLVARHGECLTQYWMMRAGQHSFKQTPLV